MKYHLTILIMFFANSLLFSQAKVATIKNDLSGSGYTIKGSVDKIEANINALTLAHPNVDIVLLPEYSLIHYDFDNTAESRSFSDVIPESVSWDKALHLQENNGVYDVLASSNQEIIDGVNRLKAIADNKNIIILAGTAMVKYEKDPNVYPLMPDPVLLNSLLIIDRSGDIVDIDYKVRASDWVAPYPYYYQNAQKVNRDWYDEAIALTNSTSYTRYFTANDGNTYSYGIIICGERQSQEVVDAFANTNLDFLFYTEFEGDFSFGYLTDKIQNNEPLDPFDTNSYERTFKTPLGDNGAFTANTVFIHSDSQQNDHGLFNTNYTRLTTFEETEAYIFAEIPNGTVLPVEFVSFSAQWLNENKESLLKWITASETENDYFEVQHSINGTHWSVVGKVEGNGNSQIAQEYSFVHNEAVSGLNYYRLRQVDFDGSFSYSNIVSVNALTEENFRITLFNRSTITIVSNDIGNAKYEVYNGMGALVMSREFEAVKGSQSVSHGSGNLSPGMYIIRLSVNNETVTGRFVVH